MFIRTQNISEAWKFQQLNWEKFEARNTSPFQSDNGYNFLQKVSSYLTNWDDLRSPNKQPKTRRFLNLHDRKPVRRYKLVSHSCNVILTHCSGVFWLRGILNSRDWRVYVNAVTVLRAGLSSLGIIIPFSLILHYCRQFQCSWTQSVILWNKSSQY